MVVLAVESRQPDKFPWSGYTRYKQLHTRKADWPIFDGVFAVRQTDLQPASVVIRRVASRLICLSHAISVALILFVTSMVP
jgi:hypothetical protein